MLEIERNYDTMSNMKDYMMWLEDRSLIEWDTVIHEPIIPEGTDIYETELVDEYHNDAKWHGHPTDGSPIHDDDGDDDFLDDDELGDSIPIHMHTLKDLLDMVFSEAPISSQFRELIDTDMLTRLWSVWGRLTELLEMQDEDEHGWTESEYWFNDEGGLTADAQNYLHELDARGELV